MRNSRRSCRNGSEQYDEDEKKLLAALAAMNGSAPEPGHRSSPRRTPRTSEENRRLALDYLRANPDEELAPVELSRACGVADGSINEVVRQLVIGKHVQKVGETPRGGAIIKHKPKGFKPGDEVKG